jgi:outer membrane protein assembly factor BamB
MTAAELPSDAIVTDPGNLVFVGFNSRVVALDRDSGAMAWSWKSPRGSGIAALLVDGDRLIVSVQGYTYCLDPLSGSEMWSNPLKGLGVGTACLASARGNTTGQLHAILAEYESQQEAAAHSTTPTTS